MTNGKTAYPYHPQADWNVVGGRAARLGNNPVRGQLLREQTLPAHERLQATERSLGWLYWLPNPLFPFIWYRVGLPGVHPALLVERRTEGRVGADAMQFGVSATRSLAQSAR